MGYCFDNDEKLAALRDAIGSQKALKLAINSNGEILTDELYDELRAYVGTDAAAWQLLSKKYDSEEYRDSETKDDLYPDGHLTVTEGEPSEDNVIQEMMNVNTLSSITESSLGTESIEILWNEGGYGISLDEFLEGVKADNRKYETQMFEYMSELVTAAVDNTKLLILEKLGIDKSLMSAVTLAVGHGVPLDMIVSITSSNEVRKLIADYKSIKDDPNRRNESLKKMAENEASFTENKANGIESTIEGLFKKIDRLKSASTGVFSSTFKSNKKSDIVSLDELQQEDGNTIIFLIENKLDEQNKANEYANENGIEDYVLFNVESNKFINRSNRININNGIVVSVSEDAKKMLTKLSDIKDANNRLPRLTEDSKSDKLKDIELDIKSNQDLLKIYKNNPIASLSNILILSSELAPLNKVLGLKNKSLSRTIDIVNFVKDFENKIQSFLGKVGDNGVKEFVLHKFVFDKDYAASVINDLQDKIKYHNPLILIEKIKYAKSLLRNILTQERVVSKTNEITRISNKIVNGVYNKHQELTNFQWKDITDTLYGYAIYEFLAEKNVQLTIDSREFDLSNNNGINELIRNFPDTVRSLQKTYDDNYLIQALNPSAKVSRYNSEEEYTKVEMFHDPNFDRNLPAYKAALDSLPPKIQDILYYYSLITDKSFKGSKGLPLLFSGNKDNSLNAEFNDFIGGYDFSKFEPDANGDLRESILIGILLNNDSLLKKDTLSSEYIRRNRFGNILFNANIDNEKYNNIVITRTNSVFSLPYLTNDSSIIEIVRAAGWDFGYKVTLPDGSIDRVVKYDNGTKSYIMLNTNERYTAEQLIGEDNELNNKLKFKGHKFGYMTSYEKADKKFNRTSITANSNGVIINKDIKDKRSSTGNRMIVVEQAHNYGDVIADYYDHNTGDKVEVIFRGVFTNKNDFYKQDTSFLNVTGYDFNKILKEKGEVYVAELVKKGQKNKLKKGSNIKSLGNDINRNVSNAVNSGALAVVIKSSVIKANNIGLEIKEGDKFSYDVMRRIRFEKEYTSFDEFYFANKDRFESKDAAKKYIGINESRISKSDLIYGWLTGESNDSYSLFEMELVKDNDLSGNSIDEAIELSSKKYDKDDLKKYNEFTNISILGNLESKHSNMIKKRGLIASPVNGEMNKDYIGFIPSIKKTLGMKGEDIKRILSYIGDNNIIINNSKQIPAFNSEIKNEDIRLMTSLLTISKNENIVSFEALLTYVTDDDFKSSRTQEYINVIKKYKDILHLSQVLSLKGDNTEMTNDLDRVVKFLINKGADIDYYVFVNTYSGWYSYENNKYTHASRIPNILRSKSLISLTGDTSGRAIYSLMLKASSRGDNESSSLGKGLNQDGIVDLSITADEEFTDRELITNEDFVKSLSDKLGEKMLDYTTEALSSKKMYLKSEEASLPDVYKFLDINEFDIYRYQTGEIVLKEKVGNRFIVIDENYEGRNPQSDPFMTVMIDSMSDIYQFNGKITYTNPDVFHRRNQFKEVNARINDIKNELRDKLEYIKDLQSSIKSRNKDVNGSSRLLLNAFVTYLEALPERNRPALSNELIKAFYDYKNLNDKFKDEIRLAKSNFNIELGLQVVNKKDEKNLIPVYFIPSKSFGKNDEFSYHRDSLPKEVSGKEQAIIQKKDKNGNIIAHAFVVTNNKGRLSQKAINGHVATLLSDARKAMKEGSDNKYYIEFPSSLSDDVLNNEYNINYIDLAKAFVSAFSREIKNKGALPSNIVLDANAKKAFSLTDGNSSILDLDNNKVHKVGDKFDDNLYTPYSYYLDGKGGLRFNNGETLLDRWNDSTNAAEGTPFYQYNANESMENKQIYLNNLFSSYFNENPSRLTSLMLELKGRDIAPDDNGNLPSVAKALVSALNSINIIEATFAPEINNDRIVGFNPSLGYVLSKLDKNDNKGQVFKASVDGESFMLKNTNTIFSGNIMTGGKMNDMIFRSFVFPHLTPLQASKGSEMMVAKNIESLIRNNDKIREALGAKFINGELIFPSYTVFHVAKDSLSLKTTGEALTNEQFNERFDLLVDKGEYEFEGEEKVINRANGIIPIVIGGDSFNNKTNNSLAAIHNTIGNEIATGGLDNSIFIIKAINPDSYLGINKESFKNAVESIIPLLKFNIKNEVSFIVPKGSGVYEYVVDFLKKNRYEFEANEDGSKTLVMHHPNRFLEKNLNKYKPELLSLSSVDLTKKYSSYLIANSISRDNDKYASLGGITLVEGGGNITIKIDKSEIKQENELITTDFKRKIMNSIGFDNESVVKDNKTLITLFNRKLAHESLLAYRLIANSIFSSELKGVTSIKEFKKAFADIKKDKALAFKLEIYNKAISEFDALKESNPYVEFNIVGSHRNVAVYVNQVLNNVINNKEGNDIIFEPVNLKDIKNGFLSYMISESISSEKASSSNRGLSLIDLMRHNNNFLDEVYNEQTPLNIKDGLMFFSIMNPSTRSRQDYYNNIDTINKFAQNGIKAMVYDNGKYVVFDNTIIDSESNLNIEPIDNKKELVKDDIASIIAKSDDKALFNIYLHSKSKIAYSSDNGKIVVNIIKDGVSTPVSHNPDQESFIAMDMRRAIISKMISSKYIDATVLSSKDAIFKSLSKVFNFKNRPTLENLPNPIKFIYPKGEDVTTSSEMKEGNVYINKDNNEEYIYITNKGYGLSNTGNIYELGINNELNLISSDYSHSNGIGGNEIHPYSKKGNLYNEIFVNNERLFGSFTLQSFNKQRTAVDSNTGDKYVYREGEWINKADDNTYPVSVFNGGHLGPLYDSATNLQLSSNMVINLSDDHKVVSSKMVKDRGNTYILNKNGLTWDISGSTNEIVRFSKDFEGNKKQLTPFAIDVKKKIFGSVITKIQELFPYMNIESLSSREIAVMYGDNFADKKGFYIDGRIIYNTDLMTLDTPLHELGHVYLAYLKESDPKKYEDVLKATSKNSFTETVAKKYPELSDVEILEETFVTLLGYHSQNSIIGDDREAIDKIIGKTKGNSFFDFVVKLINNLFKVNTRNISLDKNLKSIINESANYLIEGKNININPNVKVNYPIDIPVLFKDKVELILEDGTLYFTEETVSDIINERDILTYNVITDKPINEIGDVVNNQVVITDSNDVKFIVTNDDLFSEEDSTLEKVKLVYDFKNKELIDHFGGYERVLYRRNNSTESEIYVANVLSSLFSLKGGSDFSNKDIDKKIVKDITDQLFSNVYPELFFDILELTDMTQSNYNININRVKAEFKDIIKEINKNNLLGKDRKIAILAAMYDINPLVKNSIKNSLFISDEIHNKAIEFTGNKKKKLNIKYDTYGISLENKINNLNVEDIVDTFVEDNLNHSQQDTFIKEILQPNFTKSDVEAVMSEENFNNKICK